MMHDAVLDLYNIEMNNLLVNLLQLYLIHAPIIVMSNKIHSSEDVTHCHANKNKEVNYSLAFLMRFRPTYSTSSETGTFSVCACTSTSARILVSPL